MIPRLAARSRFAPLVAVLLMLAGCAGPAMAPSAEKRVAFPGSPAAETGAWRQVCFRMPFDADGNPRWAMDLLLAERVVAPALRTYAKDVSLWRFHRRAAHDEAGHQFSLIFYTDEATAQRLSGMLKRSPLIPDLMARHYLDAVVEDCRGGDLGSDMAATSDSAWDERLQQAWPYYIMGVSAHWLALIEEVEKGLSQQESDDTVDELLNRYGRVQKKVAAIWQAQGQHAYLHHLNSIFGYEPLIIQKYMQF